MQTKAVHVGLIDTGVDPGYMGLFRHIEAFQHIDEKGNLTDAPCHDSGNHGTYNAALLTQKWLSDAGEIKSLPAVPVRLHVCAAIYRGQVVRCILEGLEWMLSQPIQILVLPLGIVEPSSIFAPHIQLFLDKGVLPVAAVGNDGAGKSRAPGFYDSVLSIGACSWSGAIPAFSGSFHAPGLTGCIKPDLVAPGVDIPFKRDNKTRSMSGTSMASAVAARYAAWLWHSYPGKSALDIRLALTKTARAFGRDESHRCRYGRIDADKAFQLLRLPGQTGGSVYGKTCQEIVPWIDPRLQELARRSTKTSHVLVMLQAGASLAEVLCDSVRLLKSYQNTPVVLLEVENEYIPALIRNPAVCIAQAMDTALITLGEVGADYLILATYPHCKPA